MTESARGSFALSIPVLIVTCHDSLLLKVLSGLRQIGRAHHIVSVQSLRARCHQRLLLCGSRVDSELRSDADDGHLVLVVPVNLELGDARLFDENVAHKLADVGLSGRVFIQLSELVGVRIIHVVADSEELLVVVIGAREQDGSDTDNVRLRQLADVGASSLHISSLIKEVGVNLVTYGKFELHASSLLAVHLGLLENLIVLVSACLSNVHDSPRETVLQ